LRERAHRGAPVLLRPIGVRLPAGASGAAGFREARWDLREMRWPPAGRGMRAGTDWSACFIGGGESGSAACSAGAPSAPHQRAPPRERERGDGISRVWWLRRAAGTGEVELMERVLHRPSRQRIGGLRRRRRSNRQSFGDPHLDRRGAPVGERAAAVNRKNKLENDDISAQ